MRRDGRSNFAARLLADPLAGGPRPDVPGAEAFRTRQQHGAWAMRTLSARDPGRSRKARRTRRS